MGNALNADIEGKTVILSRKFFDGDLRFLCLGGFGCHSFTLGQAIYGKTASGEELRIEGFMIESLAPESEQLTREQFEGLAAGDSKGRRLSP